MQSDDFRFSQESGSTTKCLRVWLSDLLKEKCRASLLTHGPGRRRALNSASPATRKRREPQCLAGATAPDDESRLMKPQRSKEQAHRRKYDSGMR